MADSYNILPLDPDRLWLADDTPCKLEVLIRRGVVCESYAAAISEARAHARKIGQPVKLFLQGDHRFFTEVFPDEEA